MNPVVEESAAEYVDGVWEDPPIAVDEVALGFAFADTFAEAFSPAGVSLAVIVPFPYVRV